MNLLDYLMGKQLKSDIKSTFRSEGTLEDEAKALYDKWRFVQSTGNIENLPESLQDWIGEGGLPYSGVIGQYYGPTGGVGSGEYGYRDLIGTATSWENLSTNQKSKLIDAARIVQETGDPSAFNEIIQGNLEDFVTYDEDLSRITISPSQLQESFGRDVDYNVGAGAANVDIFSQQSILENLPGVGQKYRTGAISPSLDVVKPFDLENLLGTKVGYYTPEVEKRRRPLSKMLFDKRQRALGAGSGLAGYGKRSELADIAEGSYLDKVEDIYGNVDKLRAQSVDDIYSQLQDYADLETTLI